MEVVPLVMRVIRAEMRSRRASGISVPQFRALAYLGRHQGASLSGVAEHLGLTLPTTSRIIDDLVTAALVRRESSTVDRRCVMLTLTEHGRNVLETARAGTQARLAEILHPLSPQARASLAEAMQALLPIFTPGQAARPELDR